MNNNIFESIKRVNEYGQEYWSGRELYKLLGYMGLYGGLRQKDIHVKKKLKPQEKILDHMGSEELAANLFRSTQTEAKLKRENIMGEQKANKTHFDI